MKTKLLFILLASCFLAFTAWLVHVPNPAQASQVPEKYRETVRKGLEYLVKNQFEDGHWEGAGGKDPVAMTALAGLALHMESGTGHDNQRRRTGEGKYSANVRKAADWLLGKSRVGDGLIFSAHPSEASRYMYGHGLATLFLAGALENEKDSDRRQKLNDVLARAAKYIVSAQSTQGGWYHTSKVEGHDLAAISTTVIQIQALQAVENLGPSVPTRDAIHDALEYLKMALGKDEGAKAGQNRRRAAETAAMLACRFSRDEADETKDDSNTKKWLKVCRNEIPLGQGIQFGRDELTHFYYAQVECIRGEKWKDYRTAMFDRLLSSQNADGSWPAPVESHEGISVGPVYAAALWCTILQLDRNCYPSMPWNVQIY